MLKRTPPFNQHRVDLLWAPTRPRDGQTGQTRLAWYHDTLEGNRYFKHSGGAGGDYCEIRIYPDIHRASVIMTNNTGVSHKRSLDQVDPFFLTRSNPNETRRP